MRLMATTRTESILVSVEHTHEGWAKEREAKKYQENQEKEEK